jgi:hypothetical protein
MVMKKRDLGCGGAPLYTGKPTKIMENQTKSDKEWKKWGEWVRQSITVLIGGGNGRIT